MGVTFQSLNNKLDVQQLIVLKGTQQVEFITEPLWRCAWVLSNFRKNILAFVIMLFVLIFWFATELLCPVHGQFCSPAGG